MAKRMDERVGIGHTMHEGGSEGYVWNPEI